MEVYCVEWVRNGASWEEDRHEDYVLANSARQAAGNSMFNGVRVGNVRKVGAEESKRAIENGWVVNE